MTFTIVFAVLGAVGLSTLLALALGRAAARGDAELERDALLARRERMSSATTTTACGHYAARPPIVARTARRPRAGRVHLHTSGGARP